MKDDPGLEATRAARALISREYGNDVKRLIEHYLEYQQRFSGRLRRAGGRRAGAVREGESEAREGPPARGS